MKRPERKPESGAAPSAIAAPLLSVPAASEDEDGAAIDGGGACEGSGFCAESLEAAAGGGWDSSNGVARHPSASGVS